MGADEGERIDWVDTLAVDAAEACADGDCDDRELDASELKGVYLL